MKNRVFCVVLAIVLGLSVGLVGCAGEEAPQITEYTLTISSTEGGGVTSPGEGDFTYEKGSTVSLVAEAEEGHRFVNWTGGSGVADRYSPVTTVTVNGDYSIIADFVAVI